MKHRQASARLERPSPARLALDLADRIKAMSTDQGGVAAIEFGIFAPLLFLALLAASVAVGIVNPAAGHCPMSVCKMPAVPLIVKLSATMTTHEWPWAALSTAPFRVTLACGM